MVNERLVELGVVGRPHGIRGEVRLTWYADSLDLLQGAVCSKRATCRRAALKCAPCGPPGLFPLSCLRELRIAPLPRPYADRACLFLNPLYRNVPEMKFICMN